MGDPDHYNGDDLIVNLVKNPVIALPNPVLLFTGKFLGACRPGIIRKAANAGSDPPLVRFR